MFDPIKENYIIKWLDYKEGYGDGFATHKDSFLPDSFHKLKKKPASNEQYLNSKRFKYFKKLKDESGGCVICKSTKSLVVDHCHKSRKIRGVICDLCNKGLGAFRDDPKIMRKAIEFLKTSKENEKDALDYYTFKDASGKRLEGL